MARSNKTKAPAPSLTHEYKATAQLQAEAVSLNWVAALATVVVLLAGAIGGLTALSQTQAAASEE